LQQFVPLEFLRAGEEGRVHQIEGAHDLVVRLEEMGLRQGVDVRMIRPGSPCIVAFDNHRLSVRTDENAVVMIAVNGAETA
jgi:ferrous iron transport protein A